MRNKFLLFICWSLLLSLPAMAQERKKHKEADKFVWYSVENGSAIEVQNKKKEVIIPFSVGCTKVEYDYRSTHFFVRTKDNYIGSFDRTGKVVLTPGFYGGFSYEYEGYYKVMRNNKVGICNADGTEIISPTKYDDANKRSDYKIPNPYYVVKSNGKEGVCNDKGIEIIAPLKYDDVNRFLVYGTSTYYYRVKSNGKTGICNAKGEEVIAPLKYDDATMSYDKDYGYYYYVNINKTTGICDSMGVEIIPPLKYDEVYISTNKESYYFAVKKGDKEGVCDATGKEIIPPLKYDDVYSSYEEQVGSFYYVKIKGKKGVCDLTGAEIIPPIFETLFYSPSSNGFRTQINGKYVTVDKNIFANPEDKIVKQDNGYVLAYNDKVLSKRAYDNITWSEEQGKYLGVFYKYQTYIDLFGKEESPITKQIFEEAYALPDTYFKEKVEKYTLLIGVDNLNKEGYKAVAFNNIGVLYAQQGNEDMALAYYDQAAALGNAKGISNAQAIRDARKAAARQERMQRINSALSQISNSLSSMSNTMQQYNKSSSTYNQGNYGSGSGSGTSTSGGGVKREQHCTHCAGRGECKHCGGDGYVLGKFDQEFRPCTHCNANDSAPKNKKGLCKWCNGTGKK